MWLITTTGFYSVVQKPWDQAADTLTVRARAKADLDALREAGLPELGEIMEDPGRRLPVPGPGAEGGSDPCGARRRSRRSTTTTSSRRWPGGRDRRAPTCIMACGMRCIGFSPGLKGPRLPAPIGLLARQKHSRTSSFSPELLSFFLFSANSSTIRCLFAPSRLRVSPWGVSKWLAPLLVLSDIIPYAKATSHCPDLHHHPR